MKTTQPACQTQLGTLGSLAIAICKTKSWPISTPGNKLERSSGLKIMYPQNLMGFHLFLHDFCDKLGGYPRFLGIPKSSCSAKLYPITIPLISHCWICWYPPFLDQRPKTPRVLCESITNVAAKQSPKGAAQEHQSRNASCNNLQRLCAECACESQ